MMNKSLKALARLYGRIYPFQRGRGRGQLFAMQHLRGRFTLARDTDRRLWLLDLRNFIDSCVYVSGGFETQNLNFLSGVIGETGCDVLLDVGANMGLYAVTLASHPTVREIHAFEPDPRNHAQLMANLFLNDCYGAVQVHQLALGAENGEATFYPSRDPRDGDFGIMNTGAGSLVYNEQHHGRSIPVRVRVRRLDDLVSFTGRAVAVKVDVEGSELAVLQGMRALLRDNRCHVLCEVFEANVPAVEGWLGHLGYRRTARGPDAHTYLYQKEGSRAG